MCCLFAWCMFFQQKTMRGHKRTSGRAMAIKNGVSDQTVFNIRKRFDSGELVCEGRDCCQKRLFDGSQVPTILITYAATFRLAPDDRWLITFRDFPEIQEYANRQSDPKIVAQLALEAAILQRVRELRVVPFPSRPWKDDHMVETPARIADQLQDYKKFFYRKTGV